MGNSVPLRTSSPMIRQAAVRTKASGCFMAGTAERGWRGRLAVMSSSFNAWTLGRGLGEDMLGEVAAGRLVDRERLERVRIVLRRNELRSIKIGEEKTRRTPFSIWVDVDLAELKTPLSLSLSLSYHSLRFARSLSRNCSSPPAALAPLKGEKVTPSPPPQR